MHLDTDGRFVVAGQFIQHQPGPDLADANPAAAGATKGADNKARYAGEVKPDGLSMTLSIQTARAAAPEIFSLRKGVKIKLIRCL
ncbi:hypothetical protein LNV08_17235 [Paucibacter sp. TC2R-5]|uniref:hypothetical protein n=1 Tax=Paucibacter sp. TC2R-5 TaxID=2893555 RepID=UPI0021E4A7F2|nr:hypothetical protein [Paucibacter sp. TC2R-5]MCV2360718.1 hypothetical protein [Paucibacter sp. TC2R-5]